MQFNDTRETVVDFVVLPEFAFKVRRFFRDQVQVNLQKPIIDGATCDVENGRSSLQGPQINFD